MILFGDTTGYRFMPFLFITAIPVRWVHLKNTIHVVFITILPLDQWNLLPLSRYFVTVLLFRCITFSIRFPATDVTVVPLTGLTHDFCVDFAEFTVPPTVFRYLADDFPLPLHSGHFCIRRPLRWLLFSTCNILFDHDFTVTAFAVHYRVVRYLPYVTLRGRPHTAPAIHGDLVYYAVTFPYFVPFTVSNHFVDLGYTLFPYCDSVPRWRCHLHYRYLPPRWYLHFTVPVLPRWNTV